MSKSKAQGTRFESWMVTYLSRLPFIGGAERMAEGGMQDKGDIRFHTGDEVWFGECKATERLSVPRELYKARLKSPDAKRTLLFWKRLTRKKGNSKRTPDGEPVVVVMSLDTFEHLMGRGRVK